VSVKLKRVERKYGVSMLVFCERFMVGYSPKYFGNLLKN
jgi:hypothetical protein